MKQKKNEALSYFRSGFNCAQAVLKAYEDDLEIDKNIATNISCGFGGGMGKLQETCGAVTGSYMVLSIYNGKKYNENNDKKAKAYEMIQKFEEKFKTINGTTNCMSLINCDLKTEEGNKYAKEKNVFGTICEKCITDSIDIIEEIKQNHET